MNGIIHNDAPKPTPHTNQTHRSVFLCPLTGASSPPTPPPHSGTPSGRGTRTGSYSSLFNACILNFRFVVGGLGVPSGIDDGLRGVAESFESEEEAA